MNLREIDSLVAKHVVGYECVCSEPPGILDCPIHGVDYPHVG